MLLRASQRALRQGARQKSTVVMMRHGESTWNLENKFTGTARRRGTKAAFFSLESETPSSGSDAVEPTPRKRAVPPPTPSKAEASSFTQAGTTALYLRKVMKKQRRPGDWWLPKASNSTSRSPPP